MDVPIEELGGESLLQSLPRVQYEGRSVPALSGIPLLSKIGTGAAGPVYRGLLLPEKRTVAIKAIAHSDVQNPNRRARFLDHLKAAANVVAPNLVEMLDGGNQAAAFFVVTEYVDGISAHAHLMKLKERLKPGMNETGALDAAIAATNGLVAAHSAEVLHLDIRPSSLLIPKGAEGAFDFANAKLTDLGLAWNDYVARALEGSPAQTGTPGFMSPEQCVGAQDVGKAADVFSMGATLYALLCGQPPFGGLSLSIVLSSTVVQEPGSVRTWRPDVSRTTTKLIDICLQKSPSNRFADARVLLQALQISRQCLDADVAAQESALKEIEALVRPADVKQKLMEVVFPTHAVAGAPATEPAPLPDAAVLAPTGSLEAQIISPSNAALPPVDDAPLAKPIEDEVPDPALRSEPRTIAATSGTLKAVTNTDIFNDLLKKKKMAEGEADEAEPAPAQEQVIDKQEPAQALVPSVDDQPKESPRTIAVPPPDEWVDPALQYEQQQEEAGEVAPAPRRRRGAGILVAALLLLGVGVGAWKMGYLDQYLNASAKKNTQAGVTPPPAVAPPQDPAQQTPPAQPADPQPAPADAASQPQDNPPANPAQPVVNPGATETPPIQVASNDPKPKPAAIIIEDTPPPEPAVAKPDPEAEKAAAKKAEEERLANEAKKAEQERNAAEARKAEELAAKKAEDERKAADAAKKAEEEKRLAAEAAARKADEEKAALAAKKIEDDRKAAEAKKAEEEKKLAEKKAEEARLAAARKAEEERRSAEAKKAEEEKALAAKRADEGRKAEAERRAAEARNKSTAEPKTPAVPANVTAAKIAGPDVPREITLDLGHGVTMDFVLVTAGTFTMGTSRVDLAAMCLAESADSKDYQDETPAHRVDVSTFYIQKTPVTVAQFRRFVEDTKYQTSAERVGAAFVLQDRKWQKVSGACWKNPGFEQKDDHPAVMLSFRDCEAYASWVAGMTGKPVRLPGETEWEYAARGSQNFIWPWGNTWNGKLSNHSDKRLKPYCIEEWNYSKSDDGFAFTSPVGAFKNRSWCGALDMAGNVFQWCSDIYEPYPQGNSAPQISSDTGEDKDAKRVLRGGSFLFRPIDCRAAARRSLKPRTWSCELGMRLAFFPVTQ